ncbi:unnamed protein product [Brassicogethes aeneus]|uniref:Uncharacterized protein n=1 Tax=Brassicogethes aeneus TaxID=1431903 RepID=A0A9P0B875_BRAAE|nr:unnamed protein product [Brassicogethes aeneus]
MECYNEFEKNFVHGSSFFTTYQFDYKRYCEKTDIVKKEKVYSEIVENAPAPQKYTDRETLALYDDDYYVPFNLYHYPRPIVHKRVIPQVSVCKRNQKDYDVIKSRPKMYRSPAVPIDNIEDPNRRDTVIKFMYTTESLMSQQSAALPTTKREPIDPAKHDQLKENVFLKTELYEPLEESFVNKSIPWDDAQERYSVDPTAKFWMKRNELDDSCVNPLENLLPVETKRVISKLIKEDKLRGEHDLRCATYCGYIPNNTDPIPLAKTEFPISYPFLSVSQTLDIRKNDKEGHKLEYVCDKN